MMEARRISAYAVVVLTVFFAASFPLIQGCGRSDRPNVVLVVIDTLRADHLSCYGYGENTSPFLDEIASKGVLFERAYSASSWTAPGTASIHTSMYPFQHGVLTGFAATKRAKEAGSTITLNKIPDEAVTLAEVFNGSGYAAFAVSDNLNICREEGFDQGFDGFKSYNDKTARVINGTLEEWEDEIKGATPYFLYIHYNDPHTPYHRRPEWYSRRTNKTRTKISDYDGEINYVDAKLRDMFELFEWDRDTIVAITSDHGEEFYEHGESGHGNNLHVETIHVPLLFYYPGEIEAGSRVAEPVSTIDIMPTLRDLAGLPADHGDEGVTLAPRLLGIDGPPADRHILSHLVRTKEEWHSDLLSRSVVWDKWHYIAEVPYEEMLYDMDLDPEEMDNKIEEYGHTAQSMRRRFDEFESTCRKLRRVSVQVPLTEQRIEELKSLGYIK